MANPADTFKEEAAKITDEALRKLLTDTFNTVNQQRGEFGQRLIEKDTELNGLRTDKQSYSKAAEVLKKNGISAEEIPKILAKLEISKTEKEEYEMTKVALDETKKTVATQGKELHRFKAEKVLKDKFEKARAELKDEKGVAIKLGNSVINYDNLYDVQDLENQTVLDEKVKKVLSDAVTKQTEILRDIGHVGVQVHKIVDGVQSAAQGLPDLKAIGEIMKTQGPDAAIAADMARRASQQKG